MQDSKPLQEDEYFWRREKELLEKLKAREREEAARRGLAEAVGIDDHEIIQVLREMGFERDSVVLLSLIPLLDVAWADGGVSAEERSGILELAHQRGVREGEPAHQKLQGWLDRRPDPKLFERALVIIRDLMSYQSSDRQDRTGHGLVEACEKIASASGGILGLGSKISSAERETIRRVASTIEKAHDQAASRLGKKL